MEPGPRLVQALIRRGALASWAVALALTGCATGPALVNAPPSEIPAPPPAPAFAVPDGITTASIDTSNGRLAGESCPHTAGEIFLAGTEPEACTEHTGITYRVESWWNRVRDWFKR